MKRRIRKVSVLRKSLIPVGMVMMGAFCACSRAAAVPDGCGFDEECLRTELRNIADAAPGTVGIALIAPDGDTMTVNNEEHYLLMSVFKLHEALAVAHVLDMQGICLDTVLSITRSELNPDT